MCVLMTFFVSAEILDFVIQMIRYEKLWLSYIIMYHPSIFLITNGLINNKDLLSLKLFW